MTTFYSNTFTTRTLVMLAIIQEPNADLLQRRAAHHIGEKVRDVLARRGRANIAVPGGRSVAKIFQMLRQEKVDWSRVHFFVIDERLVSLGHPDSNYQLLKDHFIVPLAKEGSISPENAHPFVVDPAVPDRGARAYEAVLADHGFRFDIILLSSGEDGHVGALFPGHHSVRDAHHGFIVMDDSPKPPAERMTSSLSLMLTAEIGVLLFVGEAKREAFAKFNDPAIPATDCPAKLVIGMKNATVFTDLN
jgi:6-phosphogluconolactonase